MDFEKEITECFTYWIQKFEMERLKCKKIVIVKGYKKLLKVKNKNS